MKVEDVFGSFPVLETERLFLRKLMKEDTEDMFEYGSNPEVTNYVTWNTHQSLEDTREFMEFALEQYEKKKLAPWGMEWKETGKLIGTIDFVSWDIPNRVAEIGYVLSCDYWGKGITTEAAKKVIEFGFKEMNLVRIQARCFTENTGSERVMQKAGMTYEGIIRKGMFAKGEHHDLKLYSVLREEYDASCEGEKEMNKRLAPLIASMRIIDKYFPDCHGAILSGSAARGEVTETSDLDIIVFDDRLQASYRESFSDFGWPIEVFVHNLTSYQVFFERDCREGRASLPRMISEGTVLKDKGVLKKIQDEAKALLLNGPEEWTQDRITYRRYFITDLLDDLIGSQNRGERIFIAGTLAERLSEFVLRTNRQWTGSSKWMIRSLAQYNQTFADSFMEAFDHFYKTDDTKPIERVAASILEPYGGRLFEGFSLGK